MALFLDPGIRRVGQHLAADESRYTIVLWAAVFEERHLLGVAQIGVRLVLDDGRLAVHHRLEQAVQRVGFGLAGLVHLGNHGRCRLHAPAHGLEDLLQVGGGEPDAGSLERLVHPVAEQVVVLEKLVAKHGSQLGGDLDQVAVALPGPGVEQPLFLLLRQVLLGAAVFFVAIVLVVAPVGQVLLQRGGDLGETGEELVAELLIKRRADVLVAWVKRSALMALSVSWLCRRSGRSTATFQ